jgi:gluconate 2-dehydrogenase subunit 3-like protein
MSGVLGEDRTAVLAAMADRLVPPDEHGPGAVDTGAVRYVERGLQAELAGRLPEYVAGLDALERRAAALYGDGFCALEAGRQDALLRELESQAPGFFELVRRHVLEGMFGDPAWGGNANRAGWRLLGYPGPRPVWSEVDQSIDAP